MRNCAVTLLCPQCGKPFQTTASRKTYCSPKCLREHDNEMDRRNNLVRSAISSKQINSQAESNKELLSISAAARFLGVSRPTIYAYIKEGKLSPIRKSDAIIRIPMSQLTQADGKFFFRLSGRELDAIRELKVVCKDLDGNFVISEPVLDEEESTETEYRYTFIYDGDSETLRYDCFILNGNQRYRAYGSTYRL